jgi:hypothetical protein
MSARKSQSTIWRLRFGFGVAFVSAAALVLTAGFGGEFTGLPHFRQNCASSGNAAPHLLQAKFASGMSVEFLLVSELTKFSILQTAT